MECKNCKENYGPQLDEDFVNGECLPCRSQREFEEEEAKEKEQMERWNRKFNKTLSLDDFCYECPDDIDRDDLKGFPKLMEIWDWIKDTRDHEEADRKYWEERKRQPPLFDEVENDLPF